MDALHLADAANATAAAVNAAVGAAYAASGSWELVHFAVFLVAVKACALRGILEGRALAGAKLDGDVYSDLAATEGDATKRAVPRLPKELQARDPVAWITLGVLVVAYAAWLGGWALYLSGAASARVTIPLSSLGAYLSFTVLHDAVHGAVSPRHKWLNQAAGHLAGLPLLAPFTLFRQIHLTHHKFSSDHDSGPGRTSMDPDEWAGRNPVALMPLRWATVELFYVYFFSRQVTLRSLAADTPPQVRAADRRALVESLTFFAVVIPTALALHRFGGIGDALSVCLLIPQTLAATFLMYFFDYVPHRPHVVTYREDPFRSTNATSFLGAVDWLLFNVTCMNQNIHVVHHAYPSVPFYRYTAIWRRVGHEFLESGTRVAPLFILGDRAKYFDELKAEKVE